MDCVVDNQSPVTSEEIRNWLELPPDVLSHIFLKLGAIDILFRAQAVCSTWRIASKEPLLFRYIDMRNRWDMFDGHMFDMEKMAREAVDRSCGQVVEFSVEHFGTHELVEYVADKSVSLRCLRLVSCYQVSDEALVYLAKKAGMLEELEICHCSFSEEIFKSVGEACPQLKSFRLNSQGFRRPHMEIDDEALAIAETMPQLRRLHLFGNKLTNVGLRAILNGCLHLESLDLRQCFNINLEGDLLKICKERLIKVRLPDDSTDDYEFDATIIDGDYPFSEDSDGSAYDYDDEFCDLDLGYGSEFGDLGLGFGFENDFGDLDPGCDFDFDYCSSGDCSDDSD